MSVSLASLSYRWKENSTLFLVIKVKHIPHLFAIFSYLSPFCSLRRRHTHLKWRCYASTLLTFLSWFAISIWWPTKWQWLWKWRSFFVLQMENITSCFNWSVSTGCLQQFPSTCNVFVFIFTPFKFAPSSI